MSKHHHSYEIIQRDLWIGIRPPLDSFALTVLNSDPQIKPTLDNGIQLKDETMWLHPTFKDFRLGMGIVHAIRTRLEGAGMTVQIDEG